MKVRDFDGEWRRLERSQRILNVAWISFGVGMLSTLLGMSLRIPVSVIEPWLVLCLFVGACALVGSIISECSPPPSRNNQ